MFFSGEGSFFCLVLSVESSGELGVEGGGWIIGRMGLIGMIGGAG